MKIINVVSPNFTSGRKGYHPEAIVIHIMDGTLSGTDSWFKNCQSKVSAHYGIGKNGEVHQYVQETDSAWHAGRVNAPMWSLIKPTGTGLYISPNFYTIGIEHEGNGQSEWTEAMYNSSSELIADICKRWNISIDRLHIIGHHEIYSLKICPGLKVDLEKLVKLSKEKAGYIASSQIVTEQGTMITKINLNLRRNAPSKSSSIARTVNKGEKLNYVAYTDSGENIENLKRWYETADGLWFWGGGVEKLNESITLQNQ
jgi:N-acetyl-anhydromuramyl-L-alanine amidase AmpD